MRMLLAIPLLGLAACNVNNDSANESMTLQYNGQRIEDAASDAASTARDVAKGVGNVAASTGSAIKNEVGDVDVDLDVTRNRDGNSATTNSN